MTFASWIRLPASALAFGAIALSANAQITTNLTDPTRTWNAATNSYVYNTWKPILGVPGAGQTGPDGYLYDPVADHQTGLSQGDFVSSPGNPGFFIQTFTIGSTDYLAFRIVMDNLPSNSNLNIRLGLDADINGSIDLFFGPTFSGATFTGISFVAPGTGLNISPSTTSVNPTPVLTIAPANAFFHSASVNQTNYPGWVTQNTSADGMLSFAVPIANINSALAAVGSSATVTSTSLLRWVAFTANQQNSINQDVYGLGNTKDKIVADTIYASFSQIMNPQGQPIPEPGAYGVLLGFGLSGLFLLRRRRRA